mmetsp:Transcript_5313/g.12628  ORF Transcript_5313/g.12628 Transcript_5313/m.12628 type:complete len:217 (+) Transcript_5313:173-823(+)
MRHEPRQDLLDSPGIAPSDQTTVVQSGIHRVFNSRKKQSPQLVGIQSIKGLFEGQELFGNDLDEAFRHHVGLGRYHSLPSKEPVGSFLPSLQFQAHVIYRIKEHFNSHPVGQYSHKGGDTGNGKELDRAIRNLLPHPLPKAQRRRSYYGCCASTSGSMREHFSGSRHRRRRRSIPLPTPSQCFCRRAGRKQSIEAASLRQLQRQGRWTEKTSMAIV